MIVGRVWALPVYKFSALMVLLGIGIVGAVAIVLLLLAPGAWEVEEKPPANRVIPNAVLMISLGPLIETLLLAWFVHLMKRWRLRFQMLCIVVGWAVLHLLAQGWPTSLAGASAGIAFVSPYFKARDAGITLGKSVMVASVVHAAINLPFAVFVLVVWSRL